MLHNLLLKKKKEKKVLFPQDRIPEVQLLNQTIHFWRLYTNLKIDFQKLSYNLLSQ